MIQYSRSKYSSDYRSKGTRVWDTCKGLCDSHILVFETVVIDTFGSFREAMNYFTDKWLYYLVSVTESHKNIFSLSSYLFVDDIVVMRRQLYMAEFATID